MAKWKQPNDEPRNREGYVVVSYADGGFDYVHAELFGDVCQQWHAIKSKHANGPCLASRLFEGRSPWNSRIVLDLTDVRSVECYTEDSRKAQAEDLAADDRYRMALVNEAD